MTAAAAPAQAAQRLVIEHLGHRGEGVASGPLGRVYIRYALPGDTILAEVEGERGRLVRVERAGPDRVAAFCPYFGTCGGCAVQELAPAAYREWKRSIVVAALANAGVPAEVPRLVDAHGEGRRRATFHARTAGRGAKPAVGFMQARGHAIVEIEACPILASSMSGALPAARRLADALKELGKPLDIVATATLAGLDIDLRGCGPLPLPLAQSLLNIADEVDLARLSNHGDVMVERRAPVLRMGRASVVPPPGAFLQATEAGEAALAKLVAEAVGEARHVADLFCGVGTFALRIAERIEVHAVEEDEAALAALARAARWTQGLRHVTVERRDLFSRPLAASECDRFNAVVFDPPRAGAPAQARELAASRVPTVVAVSCNAASFARDARALVAGGYEVERVVPVDQFRHSAHVEIVGIFRRARQKGARRRRLLG